MYRRRLFTFSTAKPSSDMIFSGRREGLLITAVFFIACTTARNSPPVAVPKPPSPVEETPSPPAISRSGVWSFKYRPGINRYQAVRNATITRLDTAENTELSTNTSHEVMTLDSAELGVNFVAVIDSFATTTQGLIGPVQPVPLPVQISGSFSPIGLTINDQPAGEKCNPVHSVLFADLHNLLVPFPQQLSAGMSWTDSVAIQSCPAGIPTVSHTTRAFTVRGEITYGGQPAVMVQRVDTTHAEGEGGLQQHRLSIDAHGTGTAVYYLDVASGRIVHLSIDQTLILGVTGSSRRYQLKQDSKQEFAAVP
jgi:hypothetical protein